MTITLADARQTAEASTRPDRLAFKTGETGTMIALDEAEGIVTAIVSVTGTEDSVADIIEPGAYKSTLTRRRPKVCWAHSWERPIGRVLHIEELLPGDERLPAQTKDGASWPTAAGALVATMQFNMKSDAGREAFEAVRFYSETGECEYSIGYQVPPGKSTRDKAGIRHIKALELYELSVVLFGAHTMTGTLSIKDAYARATERKRLGAVDRYDPDLDLTALSRAQSKAVVDGVDDDPEQPADDETAAPDHSDGVMVAVYPDGAAADAVTGHISGPDSTLDRDELHVTLAYLGTTSEVSLSSDEIIRLVTDAVDGIDVLEGQIGGIGQFPDSGDGAPTWAPVDVPGLGLLREQVVDALGEAVRTDHGFTPHMTLGYDIGLIDPVPETPVTFSAVRVVYGNEQRDISLGGGPAAGTKTTPLAGMSLEEVVRATAIADLAAREGKAEGGADRNAGNAEELREYWVHGEGAAKIRWGSPGDFTRCVRNLREHMGERAKGYCANRHKDATGMWPGDKDNTSEGKATAYDPALDAPPVATATKIEAPVAEGGKAFPQLPGTYEERQDTLRAAVTEALRGELVDDAQNRYEWDYVAIDATWDDRLIATRQNFGPTADERESYEFTYDITADGVALGEPVAVELQMVAVPTDDGGTEDVLIGDTLPLAEGVLHITAGLQTAQMQAKAGRVLSGANERQLRTAVEHLLAVLAAAGVKISAEDDPDPKNVERDDDRDADPRREMDPGVDLSSTSPSAQTKTLTLEQVNADLEQLGLAPIG